MTKWLRALFVVCLVFAGVTLTIFPARAVAGGSTWTPVTTLADQNVSSPEIAVTALPDGGAVAVWGIVNDLFSATRPADSAAWSAPKTIDTGGDFYSNDLGMQPSVAVSPSGEVIAAWAQPSGGSLVIDVATLDVGAASWSDPTEISASGDLDTSVKVTVGSDGTAAAVWSGKAGISAAIRPAGSTHWDSPEVVSDPVGTNVIPAVQNPSVAVSSSSLITVTWEAYEQNPITTGLNYRLRTSSLISGQWTTPQWLSDDGATGPADLVADTDGTVTASWDDNNGYEAATFSNAGWSTAMPSFPPGSLPSPLVAGPDGTTVGAWVSAAGQLLAGTRSPDGSWSTPTLIDSNPSDEMPFAQPVVTSDQSGNLTVTWMAYSGKWQIREADEATDGTWSDPTNLNLKTDDVQSFVVCEDPGGLLYLLIDDSIAAPGSANLADAIEAASTAPPAIVKTASPSISGTPALGQTLTAQPGSWAPTPSSYDYQWYRNGAAISGATAASYTLLTADMGAQITATVTVHRSGYLSTSGTTNAVAIPAPTFTELQAPTISGAAAVGESLTVQSGSWLPTPTGFNYQWYRNGVAITGATAATYTPVVADEGAEITATVTAVRTSYVPLAVGTKALLVPVPMLAVNGAPTVDGTKKVGKVLVVAGTGSWAPTPTSYSYQWLRDGLAIRGADTNRYVLTIADATHRISVVVTASLTGYASNSSRSNALTIPRPALDSVKAPAVTGVARAGHILTAHDGSWSPNPTKYAFQWLRDGKAISRATRSTYRITQADRHQRISVRVTATRTNYVAASRTSAAVLVR